MPQRSPTVSFGLFALAALAVGAFVFLIASGFFAQWDGVVTAAAQRMDGTRTPVWVYQDSEMHQMTWPTEAVRGHDLRLDTRGIPPLPLPDDLPRTRKSRFSFTFIVTDPNNAAQLYPTTSTSSLTIAVLAFFLLLVGRNMVVSGSPMRIEPRPVELPKSQTPSGQLAPAKKSRPKKGPPPNQRRKR